MWCHGGGRVSSSQRYNATTGTNVRALRAFRDSLQGPGPPCVHTWRLSSFDPSRGAMRLQERRIPLDGTRLRPGTHDNTLGDGGRP